MKRPFLLLAGCLSVGGALAYAWNDPKAPFSTKENNAETMLVTWMPVENVQKVCESEYKRRGFGNISYAVDGCSFWNFSFHTCTVYTKKRPTMHDVGYEVRHCYRGDWH
jgi:hypothetical protein